MTSSTWRGPGWRTFAAGPASGKTVRDWITRVIAAHPCPVDAHDAALVVSELFGNAVTHGGGATVLVAYLLWPGGARIVVCDHGGPTLPRLRDPGNLTEGGRGLQVIDALAARWGSFRAPPAQVVWCDSASRCPPLAPKPGPGSPYCSPPARSTPSQPSLAPPHPVPPAARVPARAIASWQATASAAAEPGDGMPARPGHRCPAPPPLHQRRLPPGDLARPPVSRSDLRRPPASRLVVPGELEECGFGLIDWRALPGRVAVELLHAAGRIARDGHTVAFTGRPYRTGPELTIDGRLTETRYLTGQPGPVTNPAAAEDLMIATLDDLAGSTHHIAVVSAQPELSQHQAVRALTRWQHTHPPGHRHHSLDIYGHDWTAHQ